MEDRRPWKAAIFRLAALGAFFFATYDFTNWLTSQRHGVPSIVFAWERRIPFLAWTIVPYWSTDFFYSISFFLCRTRKELDDHTKRLLAVQIISVSAFLLFPLQFSVSHPPVDGVFGWMFHALGNFDRPFNQAPSLHLGLTVVLWAKYSEHLRGFSRSLVRWWFVLTAVSTLTTYQHHFIDLPTGIWVGLFCLAFVPGEPARFPGAPSRRIGAFYLFGALLLGALATYFGGLAWLLLWPAGAMAIVAVVYWRGRPELFRKRSGTMGPAISSLLAPYLAAARLNSRLWTRREPAAREIANGVWLGRLPRRAERDRARIASVVDLTAELPIDTHGIAYRTVPMLDLIVPTVEQLEAAVEAIEELDANRPTLVCCSLGYSRSAAAVAAWLIANGSASSADAAIAVLHGKRACIVLSTAHRARIEEWAHGRQSRLQNNLADRSRGAIRYPGG